MSDPGALQVVPGGGPFSVYEDYRLGYQPSTRTAAEIIAQVKRSFGDDAEAQITSDDIIRWINDGQDTIVNRNRILKTRAYTATVVGKREYQYPSSHIEQVESLHYDGAVLRGLSFPEAEQVLIDRDLSERGTPEFWTEWGGAFLLYPTPDAAKEVVLYYTERPTPVEQPTDLLSVPDKYFQAVVQYVLQQAYEMDEDWQASQAKSQQFDSLTANLGEEERTAQRMTYQTITVVDRSWE